MNQKEYELIARVFNCEFLQLGGAGTRYNIGRADTWRNMVLAMATKLEAVYPKTFDKEKFLKKCGL